MAAAAHVCRVCLEEGNIPIFGNDSYIDVSEDLIALTGIHVQEDDEYPKYLCQSCNCSLQSAIKLKVTAQYSDRILHEESFIPDHNYAIHNRAETSSCDREKHVPKAYYTEPNLKTMTPEILLYEFDNNCDTTAKISKTASKKITQKQLKITNSNIKSKRHFRNKGVQTLESRKPVNGLECRTCRIFFGTDTEYELHVQSDEHKHLKQACPICGKEYSPSYLKYHLTYHKKGVTHICDICGKQCVRKGQLVQHLRTHFFELPFKCPKCPYRGRDNYNLKLHQRSHTNTVKHQCPHCPVQCSTKSNLKKHTLIHKSVLDFKCDECQRGFHSKADLERHYKSEHLGIKEHVCNICGKAFGLRTQMMKHTLRVHKRPKLLNGRTPLYILAEQQNKKDLLKKEVGT